MMGKLHEMIRVLYQRREKVKGGIGLGNDVDGGNAIGLLFFFFFEA